MSTTMPGGTFLARPLSMRGSLGRGKRRVWWRFYNSKQAGERLNAMLEMGRSKPWPEALKALTGSPEMDATAILDYFAPLQAWLDQQNAGRACGW